MAKRKCGDVPNARQQLAIDGIKATLTGENPKPIAQILRESGYAPSSAEQWSIVMGHLRPHLQPTLDWLELHRVQIQNEMEKKIDRADYADLVRGLKTVTDAIQLLGGKPTQRLALTSDDRSKLDALLDD